MKAFSGQLFPVVVLGLLAGLTFWLQSSVDRGEPPASGKLRHDADATAENFEIRRFDSNGKLKYRVQGPYLIHYPDDDSSELRSPTLLAHRQDDAPPLQLSARNARVAAGGETVYLWEDVVAQRPAEQGRPQTIARMPDLTVQPDAGIGFTASPVEITQGNAWLTGVGMHLDNNAATFVLQAQVRGQFLRQTATTP